MSETYYIWLRQTEDEKWWCWEVRTGPRRPDTRFLWGSKRKREEAIEEARERLRLWLKAESTVEAIQVRDGELIESPQQVSRRQRYERASAALFAFVEPWNLPVNPENLDMLAYCALGAADSDMTLAECVKFAQKELAEDAERQRGMEQKMSEEK